MWPFKTIFSQTWGDGRQENSTNEWKAQRWKLLLEMPMKQKWRKCWWLLEAERKYNHSETIRFEAAHRQCMMQYIDSLSVYESVHWQPVSVLSSTWTACQCMKQFMDSLSVFEAVHGQPVSVWSKDRRLEVWRVPEYRFRRASSMVQGLWRIERKFEFREWERIEWLPPENCQ